MARTISYTGRGLIFVRVEVNHSISSVKRASDRGRLQLQAVITENGAPLQSIRIVCSLGSGPFTLRRTLGALMDSGILREEESGGAIRMGFEEPFFAQWIAIFTARI